MKRTMVMGVLVASAFSWRLAHAADQKAEAAQTFRAGADLFMHKDFEGARAALQRAYVLDPVPRYLWDLALAEVNSDHPVEALAHFRKFLSLPTSTEEDRRKARKPMAQADAKTGHLVIDVPQGTGVTVDGQDAPLYADHTIDVLPGKHAIEVHAGTSTALLRIETKAGETLHPELRFEEPAPPPPPPQLAVPGAVAPAVSVGAEQPTQAGSWWDGRNVAGVVVVGAGVATFIGAIGVAVAGSGKASDAQTFRTAHPNPCADTSSTTCGSYTSIINGQNTDATLSNVLYVSTGALAVAAVVLLWPHHRHETTSSLWIAPAATPDTAGLRFGGSF